MDNPQHNIQFKDFEKVDFRAGTIIKAEEFPEARLPAYKLWVDLGPLGIKKSSAQITGNYELKELPGKQVVCIINLGSKQIGPFVSEILVSGFADEKGEVVLTTSDKTVPNGAKLY